MSDGELDNEEPRYFIYLTTRINQRSSYLRNNKAGGAKNIRCFPHCLPDGHCRSGFCGSSMKAIMSTTLDDNSLSRKFLQSLVIVGELAPSDIQPSIQVESTITDYQLSNGTIYSKYYRGQLTFPDSYSHSHATAEIEFNSTVKSWGYSYVAHRSKKDLKHQFIMSILSINCGNEITYNCLGSYGSPEFQIQCQRRARGHVKLK